MNILLDEQAEAVEWGADVIQVNTLRSPTGEAPESVQ